MIGVINSERVWKYHTPRMVTYSGNFTSLDREIKEGDFIDSLIIDKEEIIEPRVMKVGKYVFKCNKIIVAKYSSLNRFMNLEFYYSILNRTSNYLLPTIFTPPEAHVGKKAMLFDSNFVNSFIKYDDNDMDGSIYLLYRFDGSANMCNLEEWFQTSENYIKTIQPDNYHTIYQLKIADKHTFDTFVSSKFSEFSLEHRKKLEFFYGLKKTDLKYKIIYNSEELREEKERLLKMKIPKDVSLNEAIDIKMETYITKDMEVVYNLPEEE